MPGPYGDEGHEADHVHHRLVLRDLSLRDVRDGNETAVQAGKGLSLYARLYWASNDAQR